jgi:hypothetical protein
MKRKTRKPQEHHLCLGCNEFTNHPSRVCVKCVRDADRHDCLLPEEMSDRDRDAMEAIKGPVEGKLIVVT